MQFYAYIQEYELEEYESRIKISNDYFEGIALCLAPISFFENCIFNDNVSLKPITKKVVKFNLFKPISLKEKEFITRKTKDQKLIDLWLFDGTLKKVELKTKTFNQDSGKIIGEVMLIHSKDKLRVDCGFQIDIMNEKPIEDIIVGDYIATEGTFQVFFPNTEYSWEESGW
jgi:hypothetical protein